MIASLRIRGKDLKEGDILLGTEVKDILNTDRKPKFVDGKFADEVFFYKVILQDNSLLEINSDSVLDIFREIEEKEFKEK